LIADQPNEVQILNPGVPYNQLDGDFATDGGSEPAYNLSTFLGSTYINDLDVTFITGPSGPGSEDVWMTGFVDGECDINEWDEFARPGECSIGKVSYLGGHDYQVAVPISGSPGSQGTRLFLNALFEADCVTGALSGTPNVSLQWMGRTVVSSTALPADEVYTVQYTSVGDLAASDATLAVTLPAGLEVTAMDAGGTRTGDTITWDLGQLAVSATGTRGFTARFTSQATYAFEAVVTFNSVRETRAPYTVNVTPDRDGDGRPDADDAFPDDPNRCGDSDGDECDDCSSGTFDVANDCTGGADAGTGGPDDGGCGCRAAGSGSRAVPPLLFAVLGVLAYVRRRAA
jgi:hypothetical protein